MSTSRNVAHSDETRSNSPREDIDDRNAVLVDSHGSGSDSEKHAHDNAPGSSRHPHARRSKEWAEVQHTTGAHEHAPGNPMSDDPRESELPEPRDQPYPHFKGDKPWSQRSWWYQLMPGRGIYYDVRRRAPFYLTDWTVAFQTRNWWHVAQYVVRMYFINLMPAIAYVLDMNERTEGSYGINEAILASALAAIVFPIFSIQPLTFVGVTGLINLVNYTQYDIVVGYYGLDRLDYLRVQAWALIWAAFFHFVVAIFNFCDFTRFITDMTSETFGFYVGIVYIQKGVELLIREYEPAPLDNATGWLSVTIAILFVVSVYILSKVGKTSFGPFKVRYFISSFAFAAGCIFWTGFSHFPRNSLELIPIAQLPITRSFFPTLDRPWFIDFWNIEIRWIFVGAPLGFLIMILFWFDHNVSSVMAQARQFPVKRPAGFHWDFFLLGITTLVSGFLGLPAPNGLVPQCPWSTDSLSVYKQVDRGTHGSDEEEPLVGVHGKRFKRQHIVNTRVVEQRVGHLLVGAITLATMTRPFLVALGTMPRALFSGVFIIVGWSSIEQNVITQRTLALFQDRRMASPGNPLLKVRRKKVALFVGIQWLFFAMTFAISETIAGIGFPVIIVLLLPVRYYLVPLWFSPTELRTLDAPTADADVVLASLGHETEAVTGQGQRVARDSGIAGTEWPDSDDDNDDDDDRGDFGRSRQTGGMTRSASKGKDLVDGHSDDSKGAPDQHTMQRGRSTPFAVDAEGNYRNWVQSDDVESGSHSAGSTAVLGAGAGAAGVAAYNRQARDEDDAEKAKAPETKRSKSVTQSWWGKGKPKPVQRPQTPKTPETSQKSSAEIPSREKQASRSEAAATGAAGAAAGGGIGSWFSRRKQQPHMEQSTQADQRPSAGSIEEMREFNDSPGVISGAPSSSVGPSNLPGANFADPRSSDYAPQSPETPSLFTMSQSPSEAGTMAANAVRDLQSDGRYSRMSLSASSQPGVAS